MERFHQSVDQHNAEFDARAAAGNTPSTDEALALVEEGIAAYGDVETQTRARIQLTQRVMASAPADMAGHHDTAFEIDTLRLVQQRREELQQRRQEILAEKQGPDREEQDVVDAEVVEDERDDVVDAEVVNGPDDIVDGVVVDDGGPDIVDAEIVQDDHDPVADRRAAHPELFDGPQAGVDGPAGLVDRFPELYGSGAAGSSAPQLDAGSMER